MIYNADELASDWPKTHIDKRWVLARPLSGPLVWRIKAAYGVLIGKYDALRWYRQEESRRG